VAYQVGGCGPNPVEAPGRPLERRGSSGGPRLAAVEVEAE